MKKSLRSTRSSQIQTDFWSAVQNGIAEDGGLYIPKDWQNKQLNVETLPDSYLQIAHAVLSCFTDELDPQTLTSFLHQAYDGRFEAEDVVALKPLGSDYLLELYHGPTAAFKDIALSLLPLFLNEAAARQENPAQTLILTATSGDTGKAALEGFKDRSGCELLVFYPDQRVSEIQQRQMLTSEGKNVGVCAVRGDFDDAQSAVKRCFADPQLSAELQAHHIRLSSANSINIGRLVPQIVYYFWAYRKLRRQGVLKTGQCLNFSVPTGNFGDILAGYYAKQMGLPVGKLIVASNANNILTEFFTTGRYDCQRKLVKTTSPSMDILISSNLERLLAHESAPNDGSVSLYMEQLKQNGWYQIEPSLLAKLQRQFACGDCLDDQAAETIRQVYAQTAQILDPHTAVGVHVLRQLRQKGEVQDPCVILATASCYKFSRDVHEALFGHCDLDEWSAMEQLSARTGLPIPTALQGLREKSIRHTDKIEKDAIVDYVRQKVQVMKHD